jgi:hypothetical protein
VTEREAWIRAALADAPPLTPERRERIERLLVAAPLVHRGPPETHQNFHQNISEQAGTTRNRSTPDQPV